MTLLGLPSRGALMATSARHSMPPGGYDGRNGGPARPGGTPLPHIDDLVAVPKDIDPNQSIRRLLELADTSLRQSEISRDFDRPALALKDYIRAYIIAVHTISKHQDYPTLRSKQSDVARLHSILLKKIDLQSDLYERIKRDIIADNKRSGVLPATRRSAVSPTLSASSASPRNSRDAGLRPLQPSPSNGNALQLTNGSSAKPTPTPTPTPTSNPKPKPTVQPKPPSLHGKAIAPGQGRTNPAANVTLDLAARFANLRGPQASPGQDPRIKTYPILTQKPQGPREMPADADVPSELAINADSTAAMPKVPDAIYSPVRGSVSGEAARLPTSTPRGLFSRAGSSTSLTSGTSSVAQPRQSNEYFPPAPSTPPPPIPDKVVDISAGDSITPEQLHAMTKTKTSILLIDVRPREDFDQGHIMASSIICIEPSVLTRGNVSASDISDSMVLSPSLERSLFEKRASYELVVFYDQASERIFNSPKNPDEEAMRSLHRALVLLNYGSELKNPPKLLQGGLDAWIDLMGPRSLQSAPADQSKASRIKARHGMIRRRGSKYVVTPLQAEDIKAWQSDLDKDAVRPAFPRTGDEFLRFPPIPNQRQSMAPQRSPEPLPNRHDPASRFDAPTQLPPPPARPQAAVQRPSHSGLNQGDHDDGHGGGNSTGQLDRTATAKIRTGLHNPGNWCYANSTLQSLLGSPEFGRELADRTWEKQYKGLVPRKDAETRPQPQLMIQMISNLFHWMSSGRFGTLKAQMLMEYSKHLCQSSNLETQFGGTNQQDAQEFMSFLMEQLHEETNLLRNTTGTCSQPDTKGQSPIRAAQEYWQNHCKLNNSIVDKYWRGLEASTVRCEKCQTVTYRFQLIEWLAVSLDGNSDLTLTEALQRTMADNELKDFHCDQCGKKRSAIQKMALARMPQLFCISFRRFDRGANKNNARITWDFNDFDFSPYFLNSSPSSPYDAASSTTDRGFSGPFRYECYAVIVHSGANVNSGHYYAYVRDSTTHGRQHAWNLCNDKDLTQVHIGSRQSDDVQNDVFKRGQDDVPYLVFFRRKNA